MIWKTVLVISLAEYVLCEHGAISEQRVQIHHSKSESNSHHDGNKKSEHHEEYAWTYPSYEFSYKVNDPHTHDIKGQHEKRNGDEVKGVYWLLDPNGYKRTVNYHADDHKGFNAQVDYSHEKNNEDGYKYQYSVYEEQSEDKPENNNEESNDDTNKKDDSERKDQNNQEGSNQNENNEENKEENKQNEEKNSEDSTSNNQNPNENEQGEDKYKKSESNVAERSWIEKDEGENIEIGSETDEYNKNKDERPENLRHEDEDQNVHKKHNENDDKAQNNNIQQVNRKRTKINGNNDHQNNKRGHIRQENIINNNKNGRKLNENHNDDRHKEANAKINEYKRYKEQSNKSKNNNIQKDSNKDNNRKNHEMDNIRYVKLDAIENKDSQNTGERRSKIYEHRIYINHPKFPSSPIEKKYKH